MSACDLEREERLREKTHSKLRTSKHVPRNTSNKKIKNCLKTEYSC